LNHAVYLFYGSFRDTYLARLEHLKSEAGSQQGQKIAQLNTTMVKYVTPFLAAESNHRLFSRANRIALTMGGLSILLAMTSLGITFYTTFENNLDTRNQGQIAEANMEAMKRSVDAQAAGQKAQLDATLSLIEELRKLQFAAPIAPDSKKRQ
ncbi:MAG: hypothetical protein AAB425_00400, partial [Bdellovibrionota bacterium]